MAKKVTQATLEVILNEVDKASFNKSRVAQPCRWLPGRKWARPNIQSDGLLLTDMVLFEFADDHPQLLVKLYILFCPLVFIIRFFREQCEDFVFGCLGINRENKPPNRYLIRWFMSLFSHIRKRIQSIPGASFSSPTIPQITSSNTQTAVMSASSCKCCSAVPMTIFHSCPSQ